MGVERRDLAYIKALSKYRLGGLMKTTKMFRHVSLPPAVESAAVSVVNKFTMTAYNERGGKKKFSLSW
jgi:hypothetical protein